MHFCFRVDASREMGTGHLMRCLTLAESLLKQDNARVTFLCRHMPEEFQDRFQTLRMDCALLKQKSSDEVSSASDPYWQWLGVTPKEDAKESATVMSKLTHPIDWLIVDHYALDAEWERLVKPFCKQIMAIDDLGRSHNCELLLDQNVPGEGESPYSNQVPEGCLSLLGPAYALLRPQFLEARQKLSARDGTFQRILIFFGGTDSHNNTLKATKAVKSLDLDIDLDIVTGVFYPYLEELQTLCAGDDSITIHQSPDMAQLMLKADLSLGSPGATTWERMALGLPSIVVVSADNQLKVAKEAHRLGALLNLGDDKKMDESCWKQAVDELQKHPERLRQMSEKAMKLVDGQGTRRVADILSLTKSVYS